MDDAGNGPAVAYLPGIGGTGTMARHCIERLRARGFRVIHFRYRGGGEDCYAHMAQTARAALAAAQPPVPRWLLLAESFGGAVAVEAALAEPERIAGLALVNTFARYPRRAQLWIGRGLGAVAGPRFFQWVRQRARGRGLLGPRVEPALSAELRARKPTFDRAYLARLRMMLQLDLRPRLAELAVPVALFAADQDAVVPSVRCAEEIRARLPAATLRVLPNTGHLVLPLADLAWPEWLTELGRRARRRRT